MTCTNVIFIHFNHSKDNNSFQSIYLYSVSGLCNVSRHPPSPHTPHSFPLCGFKTN